MRLDLCGENFRTLLTGYERQAAISTGWNQVFEKREIPGV
jgi:hypothetical protein